VTKGRLTRQELSWLLTQEAQNAAERLRTGVKVLRTQAPPPLSAAEDPAIQVSLPGKPPGGLDVSDPAKLGGALPDVDASLDALDDVMRMLSNLNLRSATASGPAAPPRRGRIDVAALLVEIAPDARVSIEPGSGTEVYGDEADFRRMLQLLVGHGSGEGASATVKRDGDEVRVAVTLGPDSSPSAGTERAWLSRMAMRYGGRHELERGSELLVFPAEGAVAEHEREALRRELDEARKQGELYARELAAVFERDEGLATASSAPPPQAGERHHDRFATVARLCAAVSAELKTELGTVARELAAKSKEATDEAAEALRRRVVHAHEFVSTIGALGETRTDELATEVDLGEVARAAARDCAALAQRREVKLDVRVPEAERAYVRVGAKTVATLARALVAHAVTASPRASTVVVAVTRAERGPVLSIDDAGAALPASGRRAFLALEPDAGAHGRPSGVPIFLASELAACLGASLELSDAPAGDHGGGGLRVAVTFANA
jgi:two-component system, OmpR family, sensor kinase